MRFEELNLAPQILQALTACGYTEPTPIQAQTIPALLAGRDVIGSAQTGTGKTAAFVLPALQRLAAAQRSAVGAQWHDEPARAGAGADARARAAGCRAGSPLRPAICACKTVCIYGGAPYPVQNRALRAASTCWSRRRAG